MIRTRVGALMRDYRVANELSCFAASRKLKVCLQYVSAIETGKTPISVEKAAEIARLLKQDVAEWVEAAVNDLFSRLDLPLVAAVLNQKDLE